MKTALDPRHKKRQKQVKALYAHGFQSTQIDPSIKKIISRIKQIDKLIAKSAPEWPLDQINKIDLAILRLSTYELLFDSSIPQKVSIDEAVELAKTFGAENTPSFVNGVLGNIVKLKKKPAKS